MALSVTAIGANEYPTTVEDVRQLIAGLRPGTGSIGARDFPVMPSDQGGGLAVEIGPGRAVLEGRSAVDQGSYLVWSAESEILPWPGPAAQPRIDALVVTVADAQYGQVEAQGPAWMIVQGTASTTPAAPTTAAIEAAAPAGAWARVADVRVNPGESTIAPANITRRLLPADGGWQPLVLRTGYGAFEGRPPSYRVDGGRVWLSGAMAPSGGGLIPDGDLSGEVALARVPTQVRPSSTVYGTVYGTARTSSTVSGGVMRGQISPDGTVSCNRISSEYTTYWLAFDAFSYWLDQP
ncbi:MULTISPECIES: hypothetical protein [unclassified Nocardiopsis]|uniref:hypothetical protein n=1 Tax=unclassified Nocardiopsis TaxID=2649073 RepID=UPI00135B4034|nr:MULTISPECIES: hypothetical protein [unclassified Nocardiopsis]